MIFRKTRENDIENVMKIINEAKDYFKRMEIDQWQDGYPNEEVIMNDIKNNNSYVLERNGEILATAMFAIEKDKNYENIYDGKWINDGEYAVIHRIAVAENHKGEKIGCELVRKASEICLESRINSIKIDTHKDNISMQRFLKNNDFKYCGIIYLEDDSERIAFEKVISE